MTPTGNRAAPHPVAAAQAQAQRLSVAYNNLGGILKMQACSCFMYESDEQKVLASVNLFTVHLYTCRLCVSYRCKRADDVMIQCSTFLAVAVMRLGLLHTLAVHALGQPLTRTGSHHLAGKSL